MGEHLFKIFPWRVRNLTIGPSYSSYMVDPLGDGRTVCLIYHEYPGARSEICVMIGGVDKERVEVIRKGLLGFKVKN